MEEYLLALVGLGIGLFAAAIIVFVWKVGYSSGYNAANGQKGASARDARKTQTNLAMLRAKELHDAGKKPEEIAATIVMEYPDVCWEALRKAQQLAKEMGITTEQS